MEKIGKDKLVKVAYEMYVRGDESEEILFESADAQKPIVFCQGIGMMLPAFEAQLEGKTVGDMFDFRLSPAEAYGEFDESAIMTFGRDMFVIDGKFDSKRVKEGLIIPMNTEDGQVVHGMVIEVNDTNVVVNFNHPLAGEELHFKGQVVEVSTPTAKEMEQLLTMLSGGCGGCGGDGCGDCGSGEGGCANCGGCGD